MKSDSLIVISIASLFVGVLLGAISNEKAFDTTFNVLAPAIATLVAAFLGAGYAFKLQENERRAREVKENVASGNRAIFSLMRMYSKLKNFEKQFLNPFKGDKTAFLQMQPTLELIKYEIKLDIDSLSYLLETEHGNILGELSACIGKYQGAIDAINNRSHIHLNHVLPILERAGFVEGADYSIEKIKEFLGPRLFAAITDGTDQVFSHTLHTIEEIDRISSELTRVLKQSFPGHVIIRMGKREDNET